ncbi:MAG TPA: DNRLRE domain-containing protein [Polyangiaceae bacterium]|jgi:hypothetical protein
MNRLSLCSSWFVLAFTLEGCGGEQPAFVADARDQRLIAQVSALGILQESHASGALPTAVTFGGAGEQTILLVAFERSWARRGRVQAALLHLDPREGSPASDGVVSLHASRIRDPWRAAELTWENRPALNPPYAEANAEAHGELRIDVSALIRSADKHPDEDYGVALSAERGSGAGATFATGAGGGSAPWLEVFVR